MQKDERNEGGRKEESGQGRKTDGGQHVDVEVLRSFSLSACGRP